MEKLTNEAKRAIAKKKLRREFGGRGPVVRVTPKSLRLIEIGEQVEIEKKALSSDAI